MVILASYAIRPIVPDSAHSSAVYVSVTRVILVVDVNAMLRVVRVSQALDVRRMLTPLWNARAEEIAFVTSVCVIPDLILRR
jgi:hypothetical protein